MQTTTDRVKPASGPQPENRAQWITDRATRFVISQGYSEETAQAFAVWAQGYAPEVQGFSNLFDYYVDTLTP